MTSNNENLHIKLQVNDEFRRFNVPRMTKYAELVEKIKQILSLDKDFAVKYKDDENEWITISSDIELETGLSFAKASLLRLLVSVKNSDSDSNGCDKWKSWRRKRMEEGGDEGDCKKWRSRRWGRKECDREGGDDSKKWRKNKWRKNECGGEDEDVESGECNRKWGRGRYGRKWRDSENDNEEDVESGECKGKRRGRYGRKWRDCGNEEGDGDCGKKRERKQFTEAEKEEWLEQKRKRRLEKKEMKSGDEEFNSGDELLNLEQIKKEIETLKATAEKLREKNKEAQQQLVALRTQLKDKRKGGALDDVLTLRKLLKTKKDEKGAVATELRKTFWRVKSLQKLAASKSE
jgi:hypothetical protein